ncbi:MAG: histidinol-phosphatase [Ignavibacteriales bacterium]|nr:MAG: histidinol-phosphatase [Ignavibacteriales bacterium]
MQNSKEFKSFAKQLAHISGDVIKRYFRTPVSIDSKSDNSPVTIADKKAEELMRAAIMKHYPDHGIIGEEFGIENPAAEYKWILDPIDGTKSFICGTITFGTLIALTHNGEPILGVINQPVMNEFLIGDNSSALLNGENVSVRTCDSIMNAVLLTADHLNVGKYQDGKKFDELISRVKIYRGWGDCYGYYLLATGYADIVVDPIMSVWDSMALIPVVKGAGGVITDWQGNDAITGNSIIASSGNLHSIVIQELNQV